MAKKKETKNEIQEFAVAVARLARDRHAEEILVLDLHEVSPVTDYFVIATGTSDRQLSAVADEIEQLGKKYGQKVWKVAGRETGGWVILDFVDLVVHLFSEHLRHYYDLELIWGEAPRVAWKET